MSNIVKKLVVICILVFSLTACGNLQSAKQYYKDGIDKLEAGSYEEAEESFSTAVSKKPEKAEYYIAYGMSLIKTKKYEDAFIQFDKAILTKDNKVVRENNKSAYRGKGIAYFEANEYEEAIESFDSALAIDELEEMNMDILYYKGTAEEQSGLYEEALKTFRLILDDKKDATILGKKAQMEYYLEDYENSLGDYDKAIHMDANNYDLYFGKYYILLELEKEKEAKEILDKALAIKAKSDEDYFNVAKIHYIQSDYTTAKTEFEEAAEKGFTMAYYYLGEIYEKDGDDGSAIENYAKYIEVGSDLKSATAYNQLGLCYVRTKEFQKALETFQQGIELNDNAVMKALKYNEIVAYENLIQFDTALLKADAYLKEYPDDSDIKKEYEFIKSRVGN